MQVDTKFTSGWLICTETAGAIVRSALALEFLESIINSISDQVESDLNRLDIPRLGNQSNRAKSTIHLYCIY